MSFVFIVQCMATHTYTGFLLHCAWWDSHNENGDVRRDISGVYRGPNTSRSSLEEACYPPSLPSQFCSNELQHEADQLPRTPRAPLPNMTPC